MTESDAVEQVLAGMGGATPADGMEARVLARLTASSDSQPNRHESEWVVRHGWRGVAVACVGVVLLSGIGALLKRHNTDRKNVAAQHHVSPWTGRQTARATTGFPIERAPIQKRDGARKVATNERPVSLPQPQFEAVAESTAGLESFPAPPMPLTRQERLLLRMLAGGGQAELVATLSSQAEEAMHVHEGRGRQEFFAPARPEMETERKANGMNDAPTSVDGVGHVAPALKVSSQDAMKAEDGRKEESQ